jgi:hypothetical protein
MEGRKVGREGGREYKAVAPCNAKEERFADL